MDDRNKTQAQSPSQQPQQSQAGGGNAQGQIQTQQQPQAGGVGTLVKERESPTGPSQISASEFMKPSEVEPPISRELEEIGVISKPEFPRVGHEEQEIGISPAKESVPVLQQASGVAKLLEQLETEGANKRSTSFSVRWLFKLLEKVAKHFS
jgi:hypothetical protein